MATFLVTYHGGGGMPESAEGREQMLAAFGAWAASVGDAMIDPGSPLGPRKTVTSDGISDAPADPTLGGYTLLRTDSAASSSVTSSSGAVYSSSMWFQNDWTTGLSCRT